VLSPAEDAWAVESTRRMVYLRLAAEIPWGAGIALLVLSGAVICAWADPEPDAFGPALASWNRAIRAQPFWARLLPDQPRLQWLAQG
jgi:hypothetical protein